MSAGPDRPPGQNPASFNFDHVMQKIMGAFAVGQPAAAKPVAETICRRPPRPTPDGSTTVYFVPQQPEGVKRGNWIQTVPRKGWFVILRLYGPLEPFFTKEWRPSEIEPPR